MSSLAFRSMRNGLGLKSMYRFKNETQQAYIQVICKIEIDY